MFDDPDETALPNALAKLNMPVYINSVSENIHDPAGVRGICSYIDDVYLVVEALLKQDDITLVASKDYIANPKKNGYRSLLNPY